MNLRAFKYDAGVFTFLATLSVAWLLCMLWHLDPVVFPDSVAYLRLAEHLRSWNWTGFYFRTPGYPAFLAVVELISKPENIAVIAGLQLALTACVPLLLFGIFRIISRNTLTAFLCASVFFIDWAGQLMGVAILTEALTQFFVLGAVLLQLLYAKYRYDWIACVLGMVLFALIMVRPAFLPLPCAFAIIQLWYVWRTNLLTKRTLAVLSSIVVLPLFLTALWALEVKRETGTFTISHITGIALFNQVAPEVMSLDTYSDQQLLTRLQNEVRSGTSENAAWNIIIEESAKSDRAAWEAAGSIKHLSVSLIRKHPVSYLRQVLDNSREFWVDSATYVFTSSTTYRKLKDNRLAGSLMTWTNANFWQRPGRILALLLFLCIASFVVLLAAGMNYEQKAGVLSIIATIAVCMVTHVAVNGSDLARYRMPVQTLYLGFAVFAAVWIIRIGVTTISKILGLDHTKESQ